MTFVSHIWTPADPSPSKYVGVSCHLDETVNLLVHLKEPLFLLKELSSSTSLGPSYSADNRLHILL